MRLSIQPLNDHEERIIVSYSYLKNNFQVAFTLLFSMTFILVGMFLLALRTPIAYRLSMVFIGLGLIIFLGLLFYLRVTRTVLILDKKNKVLKYKNKDLPRENPGLKIRRTFKTSRSLFGIIPFVPEYDAYWELIYTSNGQSIRILFFKQQLIDRIRDLPELDHLVRYVSFHLHAPVIDETGIEHLYLEPENLGKPFIDHIETCYSKEYKDVLPKEAVIKKRREQHRSMIYSVNRMPQSKHLLLSAVPILLLEIFAFIPLLVVILKHESSDVIKLVFMAWFFPIIMISWLLYFYLIKDVYSEDIFILSPKGIELAYKNLFYIRTITRIPWKKLQLIIIPKINETYMMEFISQNHRVHIKGRYQRLEDIQALKKMICDEVQYILAREKQKASLDEQK